MSQLQTVKHNNARDERFTSKILFIVSNETFGSITVSDYILYSKFCRHHLIPKLLQNIF